jgi:cystathionine beta-lyase/cystathionine gamma-synthase
MCSQTRDSGPPDSGSKRAPSRSQSACGPVASSGRLSIETELARGARPPRGREEATPGAAPVQANPLLSDPTAEPLVLSSVYRFASLDQVDATWEGQSAGHIYRRFGHPNAETLERLLSVLEGGEATVACSSGMAAIQAVVAAHLGAGDTIVEQAGLYGGTRALLAGQFTRFGLRCATASEPTPASFAAVLDRLVANGERARLLIVESIANPSLTVADLPGLAVLAQKRDLILVVDNTFATPLGCRPLDFGAALVVHSATKYLNGHSDVVGGVVTGSTTLVEPIRRAAVAAGSTISPLDAWLTVRGLKTLHLRLSRQQENAARIAAWLEGRPTVKRVLYPGLGSHPDHARAATLLRGFGGIVSFDLSGGREAVDRLVRRLRLISFAPSLGEAETTIMYPAITSHRNLTPEERLAAGAGPDRVRLSAGLENVGDLLADLEQALVP